MSINKNVSADFDDLESIAVANHDGNSAILSRRGLSMLEIKSKKLTCIPDAKVKGKPSCLLGF